jgi:type II secretory pathway pseudopilin PulG
VRSTFLSRRSRRPSGFTLIEILVTIGIIVFLFSLIAVVAARAREHARMSKTKSLIKRIHVVLDAYRALWKEYPAGDYVSDTWPAPYLAKGVALDRTLIFRNTGIEQDSFGADEFDKATNTFFVDAWGNPLYYRKVGPTQMLIWSYGPNKKDEIGIGQVWDDKTSAYVGGTGNGMQERMGDDISQNEVDY